MRRGENKFKIFLLLGCLALILPVFGQNTADPIAVVVRSGGTAVNPPDTFRIGEVITRNAPLEVFFYGQVKTEGEDINYRSLWDFSGNENFPRSDEDTDHVFYFSGTQNVDFSVTFYDEEGKVVGEYVTEEENFVIVITESSLKVPNAFSPNGDGINDVFKVSHQSIVKFNAYVFNRWGQELYRWGLNNIDEGWDGTYKGKTVKDGVYFIVVEAEGSDGVKYKHKGDINVLTGLGDGNYSSGSQ